MKKTLLFLMVAALLCALCSCSLHKQSPSETEFVFGNNYEVYVATVSMQTGCLTGFTKIDSCLSISEPPEPSEKTKTIRIGETDHVLNYVSTNDRSWGDYTYEYANADDTVTCLYWADTMELARVSLDGLPLKEFAHMDQSQYEQWVRAFVAQFSDDDWDSLIPSCSTHYTERGDNYSSGCNADGFKTEFTENEHLNSYHFQFVRYLDSVATTDDIEAHFSFIDSEDSKIRITVWLNKHAFDPYTAMALDMETIETVITEFVDSHIYSNYTKKEVELNWGMLTHIDGNLMYYCSISVEWVEHSILGNESSYNLLIDIPDP